MSRPPAQTLLPAALLVTVAVFLYCNLFLLPGTPILQSDDQVYFWMHAQRMLAGELPYLDFFQYTPPGTDFFFLALFKVFGPRIWVLNSAVVLLGVAQCWVAFRIARHLTELSLALVSSFFYVVVIFSRPLNATHHWFSTLFVMCAVAILMPERSGKRVAAAGALLGLASFFTQTHGLAALIAVATFLWWEQVRDARAGPSLLGPPLLVSVSYLASLLVLYSHFLVTVGPRLLWYDQVTYVHKYALQGWSIPNFGLPASLTIRNLPTVIEPLLVHLLIPLVLTFSLLTTQRNTLPVANRRKIVLLSLVGLFLFAEVALNPNWLRVYAVSMPGILLTLWALAKASQRKLEFTERQLASVFLVLTLLAAVRLTWIRHRRPYVIATLPAGTTAVPKPQFEEIDWLARHTTPGEFFFQAEWPGLYVPLALRNPLFLDAAGTNNQTRPEDVDLAIAQLDHKQVRFVLWSPDLDIPDSNPREHDHLQPLREYLHERYILEKTFSTSDQLWQRK